MLRVRDREGGRWHYVPTDTWRDGWFFNFREPDVGWKQIDPEAEAAPFADDRVPRDQRFTVYVEGQPLEEEVAVEREAANFNRNWSAEWRPEEPGAGEFPFSLPEVRAVAQFMTAHKNIFFDYSMHCDNTSKSYQVRPPMDHPYDWMPAEDNDYYTRLGASWSAISGGGIMENNYYSQELMAGGYGETWHGFKLDWSYMQLGVYSLSPENSSKGGQDYDGDGKITLVESLRWNDEQHDGEYFKPWKEFDHPELGKVEIGGLDAFPNPTGEQLAIEAREHYEFLTHVASQSPLLRIKEVVAEPLESDQYRVTAVVQNLGYLPTYVNRNALKIRRDFPINVSIETEGGELTGAESQKNIGHILGRHSYLWRWGAGADESTKSVEWIVRSTGGPLQVSVFARAHRAGQDQKTITVEKNTVE